MAFPSVNEAQRLVDQLLWAAVKSHTVKVWGRGTVVNRQLDVWVEAGQTVPRLGWLC